MPYKFQSKIYSLEEKHPVSKRRFEAALEALQNLKDEKTNESGEFGEDTTTSATITTSLMVKDTLKWRKYLH